MRCTAPEAIRQQKRVRNRRHCGGQGFGDAESAGVM
jgi:hypothetical protein